MATITEERTRSRIPGTAWDDMQPELGRRQGGDGLAKALGWFSIGLGATQLLAPRRLARAIGVDDGDRTVVLMRTLGAREMATGFAILAQPDNPAWLAARVGGDVMDLALLGKAMRDNRRSSRSNGNGSYESGYSTGGGYPYEQENWEQDERDNSRVGFATAAVLGAMMLDAFAARKVAREQSGEDTGRAGIEVHKTMTVSRSPEEAYRLWRDFEGLPRFMSHLESVRLLGEGRSRWTAKGPAGTSVEWDAELIADRPSELIAWRSLPGAAVANAGTVRFNPAPGGRGTEVHVELRYAPPAGKAGAMVAKLFGREPSQEIDGDLRRFKQVLETGEVTHSDASIHRGMHPAQPSEVTP